MKVLIDGTQQVFDFCTVQLSIYNVVQSFEIQIVDYINKVFPVGAPVQITHENDEPLIEGSIEYKKLSKGVHIYAGQNNAKILLDSGFSETKQFSKGAKLHNILRSICGPFDIGVLGSAEGLEKVSLVCEKGSNVGETIKNICMYCGADLKTTSANVFYVGKHNTSVNNSFEFVYGGTILEREVIEDLSKVFDRYRVVSLYNQAYYGPEGKEKILQYDINLTQSECLRIAHNVHNRNLRKRTEYKCVIRGDEYVVLNDNYIVQDVELGINQAMTLKSAVHKHSDGEYKIECVLEGLNDT